MHWNKLIAWNRMARPRGIPGAYFFKKKKEKRKEKKKTGSPGAVKQM